MFHLEAAPDLELALLTEGHSRPLFDLIEQNREELRPWLLWVDGTKTLADAQRLIRFGLRQYARSNGLNAGVWYQGQLAGVISYNYIDHARQQTEIGYWLGTAYQGHGFMTEACRTMTTYAFAHLGLERVEIHCAVQNLKSRAIPERLGFDMERVMPVFEWASNHFVETLVFSMSAALWQERNCVNDSQDCRRRQF